MPDNNTAARLGGGATAADTNLANVDCTAIAEFLTTLRTDHPNGLLEFRLFANGDDGRIRPTDRFWSANVTDAVEHLAVQARQGGHCFVGIAARSQSGAGGKASLAHTDWLWCDLDFNKLAGGELEACERIKSYPRQPQMIVATGGGFHVYYRIQRTPLPEFQTDVETALKQLTADLGGDRAACDTARILRLPGTWNTKPEYSEPRNVRFALSQLCAPGTTYRLMEFYAPPPSAPPKPSVSPKLQQSHAMPFGTGVSGDANDILSRALKSQQGQKIARLMAGDTTGYRSHSEADQALCGMLAFWCGPNGRDDVDRIFRMSNLFRPEKWDETHATDGRLYSELTVDRAYRGRSEFYDEGYTSSIARLRQTLLQEEQVTNNLPLPSPPANAEAMAVSEQVAPDVSSETPGEKPKSRHATPGETLAAAGLQLDGRLARLGVKLFPCGLFMPGTIDREDIEKIGSALQQNERAQMVVVRFLWADWYNAIPRDRGARTYIVNQLFRDNAPRRLQEFSDWAGTARRIPQEKRQANRPWSFYEKVARLPDDRRDHWLSAERFSGMMAAIEEELRAGRKPTETAKTGRQTTETGRINFAISKVTASECVTLPQVHTHVVDEWGEVNTPNLSGVAEFSAPPDVVLRADVVTRLTTWAEAQGIDPSDPSDIVSVLLKDQERPSAFVAVPDPLAPYDELIRAAQAGCLPSGGTYHLSRCDVYTDLNVAVLTAVANVLRPCGNGPLSAWLDLLDRVQALVADLPTQSEEPLTEDDPFGDLEVTEPEHTLETPSVPIRVELSDAQLAEAARVAAWRKGGHDHCRRASEDAGGDAVNLDRDLWGARAEIGVRDLLHQMGLEPQGWEMTGNRTPKGSDFKLNGTSFDVKAVPKRHACVNEQQRLQGKADRFLFAIFESERTFTLSEPIHYNEVARWQLMTNRHSPYRSIDQQTLPRLHDIGPLMAI